MRGENSEIDLVDVSLFLIRKWLSIMIATFIFVAIGYVFVSVQHDTKVVSMTIKPNLDTPATYALCGYTNDIQCKTTVILNQFSRFCNDPAVPAQLSGFGIGLRRCFHL